MIKQAVILAAGEGRRMKAGQTDKRLLNTPKPLLELPNMPIIERSVRILEKAGMKVAIVINPKDERLFREKLDKYGVRYCYQKDAKGTANALFAAKGFVKSKLFLVLMGDDIFSSDIIDLIDDRVPTIFSFRVSDISKYGKIIKDRKGIAKEVLEKSSSGPGLANTGIYLMPKTFFDIYRDIRPNKNTSEYYLTDVVKMLFEKGEGLKVKRISLWKGINTPRDLREARNL